MTNATECNPFRVIFTARDSGAAGHIGALASGARERGMACLLVAEEEAGCYLATRGVAYITSDVWLNAVGQKNASSFVISVAKSIQLFGADIVVCGRSSSNTFSIDEGVIIAARSLGIPSVVIQDFWGDVWPEYSRPDHYLVIDELAASITRERTKACPHVVGSLKHSNYRNINFQDLRKKGRSKLGLDSNTLAIGYFGQALFDVKGYRQMLTDLGQIMNLMEGVSLFYKSHPRETNLSSSHGLSILTDADACPIEASHLEVEVAIATADVVLSCFSTVGLDSAYMMGTECAPEVSIVYADYPADVSGFWRLSADFTELPLVTSGVALRANDKDNLEEVLRKGLESAERKRQASACRSMFQGLDCKIDKACELIANLAVIDKL